MKGFGHPSGTPGGLSIEVKLGEAIVLSFGDLKAEITLTGIGKHLAQIVIRAPKEIHVDRKNWKPKA